MTELPSARAIALKENARRGDWTDGVEFEALPQTETPTEDAVPYATHRGVLNIGQHEIVVYRLNDGRAIVDADCLEHLFADVLNGLANV